LDLPAWRPSKAAFTMSNDGADAPPASVQGTPSGRLHANEIAIAIRNAVKLGGSLVLTWSVALIVKFQIPAHLGPVRQGHFGFAEGFAMMFFSITSFGIETYVIKEVPVRPSHASDFIGGVFALRFALSLLLFGGMWLTLAVTGRSGEIQLTALVFGISQLLMSLNGTLAAVLQAVTHVGRLALANVLAKVIWGVGLLVGLFMGAPMWVLAVPMAAGELLRTAMLVPASRTAAQLRYRIDVSQSKAALVASIPYFVNTIAVTFGNYLAISALEFIRRDPREVGWFAASQNLGSLAMLLHPLLVWVVMPMLSRAQARSPQEAMTILRRAIEGLLVVIGPVTTFISAGADVFIHVAFGAKYAPATLGLSILSLVFVMTYLNIIQASSLIVAGRSWAVTSMSTVSIFVLAGLMLVFVPLGRKLFGEGGECAGAAVSVIASELFVVICMGFQFDSSPLDRRNTEVLIKTIGISATVLVLNHFIHGLGAVRLVIDMTLYVSLMLALSVLRISDLKRFLRLISDRRAEKKAASLA
jgi:O-antigen/teichoic acid export membrane protein